MMTAPRWKRFAALAPLLALLLAVLPQQSAQATHTPAPTNVTIAGNFQSELGCASDYAPDCALTHTVDQGNGVWRGEFNIPAGTWKYKAALNDSYNESYAGNHPDGGDTSLNLAAASGPTTVRFYYDHKTHAVLDSVMDKIATVAGSFQSELGCPSDWSPACVRSLMTDTNGDGVYTFETTAIPPGAYEFKVALNESWTENYGAGGAPGGGNIAFSVTKVNQPVFFSYNATTHAISVSVTGAPKGDLNKAQAQWLTRDTIAWNIATAPVTTTLHYATDASLALGDTGITGGQAITLTLDPAGLSATLKAKYPHLAAYKAFTISPNDQAKLPAILKSQTAIEGLAADGTLIDATELQIPGVLDDLYTYTGPLGVTYTGAVPTLRVWAPTAQAVALHVFSDATSTLSTTVAMTNDPASGVWTAIGTTAMTNRYYQYEVKVFTRAIGNGGSIVTNLVTDPYSLNLSQNSTRSQIINLNDAALKPAGWDMLTKPRLDAPEDVVLYELHVRDFSATDATVPAAERGKFKAFSEANTDGAKHLRKLAQAGLTHVHLLPAFDCASINEDPTKRSEPDTAVLNAGAPDGTTQQAEIKRVRDQDGFNWCYDPYHYTVPEGSYASDANGTARVLEFREMVQGLSRDGLRTVMDVVYNHTSDSGQSARSVLDKIVPGYYYRLSLDGNVINESCCQDTAAEHAMMEKLMVDSVTTWATAYKVDGFRFDLMSFHPLSTLTRIRDTLHALTLAKDGVDGAKIYLYGEGWNFGAVGNDARFVQATQKNLAGTGIGSFNDRLRDGVRGVGPFDSGENYKKQGFISGLFYDPNGFAQGTPDEQKASLLQREDWIRIGLAGNLKDYSFTDRTGTLVKGSEIDYFGQKAGYTADPQEDINYDEAHDGLTLFDLVQLNAPPTRTLDERIRMLNMGNDLIALGQGIPFFHAGQDLLRSKSFDPNSYNSGDWFNRLDWSYATNNFGVGLPPDQESNWPVFQPLLANPALKPAMAQIAGATAHFQDMLRIRKSTPLFRLRTGAAVQSQLSFLNSGPNQTPGLIVMQLSDTRAFHFDNPYTRVVVLFNATAATQTFNTEALRGQQLRLHPVQANSADVTVRSASYNAATGTFSVPARTTAVFVTTQHQVGLPEVARK